MDLMFFYLPLAGFGLLQYSGLAVFHFLDVQFLGRTRKTLILNGYFKWISRSFNLRDVLPFGRFFLSSTSCGISERLDLLVWMVGDLQLTRPTGAVYNHKRLQQ